VSRIELTEPPCRPEAIEECVLRLEGCVLRIRQIDAQRHCTLLLVIRIVVRGLSC